MLSTNFNESENSTAVVTTPPKKRGRPPAPVAVETLWQLLQEIEQVEKKEGKITLYRGHTSYRHKLRPAIFRDNNKKLRSREHTVLRELITKHPDEFLSDVNVFENLVRMQHYGLPTRLLDVTYNPLVATYFACEINSTYDAEVISITVDIEKFKYYDSDTVHCISNLANLTQPEQKEVRDCKDDECLQNKNSGKRLFDFIVQKRPNFSSRIKLSNLFDIMVVSPKLSNPRIRAQNGAFLIFGLDEELKKQSGFDIKRHRIEKSKVDDIKKSLDMLGINKSSIYPSLENTANQILEKYSAD